MKTKTKLKAGHVDGTVHLFEKWGLPIWKDKEG